MYKRARSGGSPIESQTKSSQQESIELVQELRV
jgi:hypothetical protein